MSLRTSSLLACIGLAACGGPASDVAEAGGTRVECLVGGAHEWSPTCMVREDRGVSGVILVVSDPDGGFRRLRVTDDGRGVVAADGAEPARVVPASPGLIEVSLGGNRYRLPATVKPLTGGEQ